MKYLAVVALAVVCVVAEPPAPVFIARYIAAPQAQEQVVPVVPYPVAALQPQAAKQQVPQTAYNPPQATTESARNSTEDSAAEATTEPQSEPVQKDGRGNNKDSRRNDKLLDIAQGEPVEQGVYYLYHPNGVLQRIMYATSNDVRNMAYVAQLRYQNVQPIKEPIYTYDPQTYTLQQVRI